MIFSINDWTLSLSLPFRILTAMILSSGKSPVWYKWCKRIASQRALHAGIFRKKWVTMCLCERLFASFIFLDERLRMLFLNEFCLERFVLNSKRYSNHKSENFIWGSGSIESASPNPFLRMCLVSSRSACSNHAVRTCF